MIFSVMFLRTAHVVVKIILYSSRTSTVTEIGCSCLQNVRRSFSKASQIETVFLWYQNDAGPVSKASVELKECKNLTAPPLDESHHKTSDRAKVFRSQVWGTHFAIRQVNHLRYQDRDGYLKAAGISLILLGEGLEEIMMQDLSDVGRRSFY